MIFQYPHAKKTTEVLTDLITINNDRIAGYQSVLNKFPNLDTDLRDMFYSTISDAIHYKQQLILEIRHIDGEIKGSTNMLGIIYRAWRDLKITMVYKNQKGILSSCLYNEKIALQAYKAALSTDIGTSREILQLIEEQEDGLKKNYELLKSYREVTDFASSSFAYFV